MPDRPNVLVVLCDQWRAEALGCIGDPNVRTPAIDRLAAEGVCFERAYTPYPVCSPARGSIQTGRYPHAHGVTTNTYHRIPLPAEEDTLAERLRDAGYHTGYVGKWHLDGQFDPPGRVPPGPRRQGYEFWKGFDRGHQHLEGHPHFDARGDLTWEEGRQPDIQADITGEFIDRHQRTEGDRPFFAFLSWGPPHTPFEAPDEYSDMYDADDLELRANVPDDMEREVRADLVEYYGMCTWLDDQLERLLDTLAEQGVADDTLVVFTADHGEMMGSNGRYHKGNPHEESVHVPLVARYPDGIEAGRRSSAVVSLIDLLPTLCSVCDAAVPEGVHGVDLSDHLLDGAPGPTETYIEGALPFDHTWRAIRTEQYLLSVDRHLDTQYLFDTGADPYQQENRAGDSEYAAAEADLRERLFSAAAAYDDRDTLARYSDRYVAGEDGEPLPDPREHAWRE
ncbi:MAG: sulfatase [Halobacteriaceae archaeon]